MNIIFVGNFQVGYVGELADEVMLIRDIEKLDHKVFRIPRDIWKAHCDGLINPDWNQYLNIDAKIDACIICKWPHFDNAQYINLLRSKAQAPVFYWTWDMMDWPLAPNWHVEMARAADLHLTNEGGDLQSMKTLGVKPYYFPFDVSDGELPRFQICQKKYDVTFFGSCVQKGDRIEWLKEINKVYPVKIFGWNFAGWKERGFDAEPPVYGTEFSRKVGESKIILGFNVDDHCWGYWSNRTGKVLTLGGFLLYRYAPGMELFLRKGVAYFSSPQEAIEKIKYYLEHEVERDTIAQTGLEIGRNRFTSLARMTDLMILIDRYKKGGLEGARL